MDWEKNLCKNTSDKTLLSKIHKEIFKLSNDKTNNPVKMTQSPIQGPPQRR
jgi:hypothetical protein